MPVFLPCFFSLALSVVFFDSHHAMQKTRTHTSPSTLTRQAQARILRKHLNAFVKAQAKATEALRAINEIALLENEGNPLTRPLLGTDSVVSFAQSVRVFKESVRVLKDDKSVDDILTEARQALDASGYWASND